MKDNTKLAHGVGIDKASGSMNPPIYRSVPYTTNSYDIDDVIDWQYLRGTAPTENLLCQQIAELEHGYKALATASGMGAIGLILKLFGSGDHIIVTQGLYAGTYRLFTEVYANYGLEFDYIDTSDLDLVKSTIKENTKAIYLETPSNPLMTVSDIEEVSKIAKENNILLIVDNTFLTSYFQKPILHGADIVIMSGSKFLGGHNDILAGFVVTANEELYEKLFFMYVAEGSVLPPEDSWLMLRSLKTLAVRLERQTENAKELAEYLKTLPEVKKVFYVGDKDHPNYDVSLKQTTGFGAMISFKVKHPEEIRERISRLKVMIYAVSLGGTETLITDPFRTTQSMEPEEERYRTGCDESLIRISVGIEDIEDLKEDLRAAFS